MRVWRPVLLSTTLALAACPPEPTDIDTEPVEVYPDREAGVPLAGAAEGTLKLPVGTPLAGYSFRCKAIGGYSKPDDRDTHYNNGFVPSAGVHIRPTIKAIWIENGDQHLVMTKTDSIYSFDGLVEAVTARLEELTGESLQGQVTHSANHNHSSYGTFSKHAGLFLGHDNFNQENFDRMVDQIASVAFEAYETRREAAIGIGWAKDWDPNNLVYSDRRGENDDLIMFEDEGPEQSGKDPYMQLMRIDDASTSAPIAIMMGWGMHPYINSDQSAIASADATALVETEVSESFDTPVVSMFINTSGGDASVRGGDDSGLPKMEAVGLYAKDAVLDLWEATPTSSDPIVMETHSRAVDMNRDKVHITRNGTTDLRYAPYDEDATPDDVIYGEDGEILSPIDEFNTEYGAVFCGEGGFNLGRDASIRTWSTEYEKCVKISFLSGLIGTFFGLDEEQSEMPLDGLSQTYTAFSHLGPLPVRYADGTESVDDALFGFFPGETTHFFTAQWRRRAENELGYTNILSAGYSMDHEGYLLPPEDWLKGGYEPDISFRGPLAGEYVMEQVILGAGELLASEVKEPFAEEYGPAEYDEYTLPAKAPDPSPRAGERVLETDLAEEDDLYLPRDFTNVSGFALDLEIPEQVPRVQGMIQFAWIGGDSAVDNPRITLERLSEAGSWEVVTSPTGRPVNDDHHDFVFTHTPDPLTPADAMQTHRWWVIWQAAQHVGDREALPLGTYRLHIAGKHYVGDEETYPWSTDTYELTTPEFEVVPAAVTLTAVGSEVEASLVGPTAGFRLINLEGRAKGNNPLQGPITAVWTTSGGETIEETLESGDLTIRDGKTVVRLPATDDTVTGLTLTDAFGNTGTVAL